MADRLNSLLELHKKDPNDSFLIYGIALEYISSGNLTEAENYLQDLLKKDPKYVPGYMQLAMLKEKQEKTGDAKSIYLKGIAAAKKTGDLHALKEMEDFLDELE